VVVATGVSKNFRPIISHPIILCPNYKLVYNSDGFQRTADGKTIERCFVFQQAQIYRQSDFKVINSRSIFY
jgi:hypothetical protein